MLFKNANKCYVLNNSYSGTFLWKIIKITYLIRPKRGELFSKKNKSYVTCIRDTRVAIERKPRLRKKPIFHFAKMNLPSKKCFKLSQGEWFEDCSEADPSKAVIKSPSLFLWHHQLTPVLVWVQTRVVPRVRVRLRFPWFFVILVHWHWLEIWRKNSPWHLCVLGSRPYAALDLQTPDARKEVHFFWSLLQEIL